MWWDGKKSFNDRAQGDAEFIDTITTMFKDAINANSVSGILTNESIDISKRVLIFYLDLWHSKWFPYDDFDLIFEY